MTREVVVPVAQLRWLRHLAEHGRTRWEDMPKNTRGRTLGNLTYRAMVAGSWITTEFVPSGGPADAKSGRFFEITTRGRAVLSEIDQSTTGGDDDGNRETRAGDGPAEEPAS
jgi:hypothetical protein